MQELAAMLKTVYRVAMKAVQSKDNTKKALKEFLLFQMKKSHLF